MEEEKTIWMDSSSQVTNLSTCSLCGLFFWFIVPIFIFLWNDASNPKFVLRAKKGDFNLPENT